MTDLLYLPDNDDITTFTATVETATDTYIVLEGTYFYPAGGGQPADHGRLKWDSGSARVTDVQKDGGTVKHVITDITGTIPDEGDEIHGDIDDERREQHRRMHTAQHVLSYVVLEVYDATTAGNQIHADRSRIDFEPASFSDRDVTRIEEQTNDLIEQDLPVMKQEMPREAVEDRVADGRTNLDLIPDHVDPLRVVAIGDIDICPCGGTHVDSLGDIGRLTITDCVSKGADVERIEFELEDR
jgi:misacylated tRNA(Ala) deacylase